MRICLFEDHSVIDLEPLTLTRPAFDLFCGLSPLSSKLARFFAPCTVGTLVRPMLAELQRERRPDQPVNDADWLRQGPIVLVNARWLPPDEPRPEWARPCIGMIGGDVAYVVLTPDTVGDFGPVTIDECLDEWKQVLPRRDASGAMIARPWDLIERNGEQIERDFRARGEKGPGVRPMNFSLVGPAGRLAIDPSARIDPLVVADTTNGPVVVDRDAVIGAFTRLEGPCYVGPGTQVLGAKIRAGTT